MPPIPSNDIAIPWRHPDGWDRAVEALDHLVRTRAEALSETANRADQVRERLERLFPLLDLLCRGTCPQCPDPCCLHAAVYADFRDLLFLTLTRAGHPPGQLRERSGDVCRYLTRSGCRLPRMQRPWACTWYLCAAQRALLRAWPSERRQTLQEGLDRIRGERRRMEEAFLRAVT